MVATRERPSFEDANNVTVQRCFFAYEFAVPYISGKIVADIGCANGYGTVELARHAQQITGMDYSSETVEENLKTYADRANMDFKVAKVPPIPLPDESVDVVTAFQFIEHIHPRLDFMKDVYRVLKPGGVFLCTTPNRVKSIARNPFHVFEYTFPEMEAEAKKVFPKFELKGLNGNAQVNNYYADNARWARKILRLDPLGIHKMIPASWLTTPYNLLNNMMRNSLKDNNKNTTVITTQDFLLQDSNLQECWDIYLIGHKS